MSSDVATTERLLQQIISQHGHAQEQMQTDADQWKQLKETLRTLGATSSPEKIMALLAPRLFSSSAPLEDDPFAASSINSREALSVISLLLSTDPAMYRKPASRAVRVAAECLASPPNGSAAASAVVHDDVLAAIVSQLGGKDVESASNAAGALKGLSRALGPPFQERAARSLGEVWRGALLRSEQGDASESRSASMISVRCASASADLAVIGDAAMASFLSAGAGDMLLDMATDVSDPLLQVSAVDILEYIATELPMGKVRAQWLFSHRVLHELLVMAGGGGHGEEKEQAQPDHILGGPALRVLSSLCKLGQRDASLFSLGGSELLTGFHRALHGFDEYLSGEADRMAYIDAVSSFASASPDAIALVLDDPILRDGWLSVRVAQPKLKSVVLHSVSMVIDPPAVKDQSGDSIMNSNIPSNQISMLLFNTLGDVNGKDATELVLSLAKSPLVELRLGSYELLRAVSKCSRGAQVLLSCKGFYDFLLLRENETTKEGREAKFEIVKAIMGSNTRSLLADSITSGFEKILKQGPHYHQGVSWELATE